MWKIQDFSATQILREINVGHFEFLGIFDILKREILSNQNSKPPKWLKWQF